MDMTMEFRAARKSDAPDLAELVNYAGEGMPLALWATMAEPGQDAWDVGRARAARDEGSFSWRNAQVAEIDGVVAGMIVTYVTAATPEVITEDLTPIFVPLLELENMVPQTRYVNILATKPEFRRLGIARRLIMDAEVGRPANGMSLIVADQNTGARRFYEGLGYREMARAPVVAGLGWETDHKEWILITKP